MDIRNSYHRERVQSVNDERSLTKQEFKDELAIENILRRFGAGQLVDQLEVHDSQFLDVSELPDDYIAVLDNIRKAESAFLSLPAAVRTVFGNETANYLDYLHDRDPRITAKLVELGFLSPEDSPPSAGPSDPVADATPADDGAEVTTRSDD
jgi:hypothetical protein